MAACEAWRVAGRAAALHHVVGQHGWTSKYEDLLAGPVCQQFGLRWAVTRPLRGDAHAPDRAALAQPPWPSQDRGMTRT